MEPSPQLPAPLVEERRDGRPPAEDEHGRWCPYCGADLSHVPVREDPPEEALFATAGRRLKVGIAVAFVLVWLALSVFDWLSEPSALTIPGWFSALGALMLFYLLGLDPMRFLRRRH